MCLSVVTTACIQAHVRWIKLNSKNKDYRKGNFSPAHKCSRKIYQRASKGAVIRSTHSPSKSEDCSLNRCAASLKWVLACVRQNGVHPSTRSMDSTELQKDGRMPEEPMTERCIPKETFLLPAKAHEVYPANVKGTVASLNSSHTTPICSFPLKD